MDWIASAAVVVFGIIIIIIVYFFFRRFEFLSKDLWLLNFKATTTSISIQFMVVVISGSFVIHIEIC